MRRKPVEIPGPKRALTLALCCAAQFMVVLDVAIVNVALPAIQVDLGMGESALQWIVIAYGLLLGGFLLLGGRLGDLLGRRRVLLTGLAIFSGASLVAGLSGSAGLLIAARAIQGFGAALVAPSALSILAVTFPEGRERNWALGIFGAIAGTSASVGVLASGLLTDGPGWSWIFFINVPIGAALILLAASILPADRSPVGSRRFDALGASTVTSGLLLLVYALNRGVDHGWASTSTLALLGGAVALLATFAVVESRSRSALVPANVLRNRMLVAADLASFLASTAFFSFIFLGSLLMQQVLRYSPTHTGVAWLATSATAFFTAGLVGARLASLVGVKRLVIGGMSLLALGVAWLTRVPSGAAYLTDLMPAFLLAGIAIGMSAPSVQIGALSGVRGASAGLASGLVETMRQIGGAVGIAVVTTVLVTRTNDGAAALQGFRSAFIVIAALAALGAVVAAIAFPGSERLAAVLPASGKTSRESDKAGPGLREGSGIAAGRRTQSPGGERIHG
jgi:EmrB/QacA subfamily drug resistance transporter